jgi:ribonucleoside-diphosphate reductase alpha chain
MPDERRSVTHKFRVGEQEGYVTVGLYDDGLPGEIFVNISKEGSTIRGLMDNVAVLTSMALQYGVPLRNLVDKFRGVHFEPAGFTGNADIPTASSLVDYIFRWLELRYLLEASPIVDQKRSSTSKRGRKTTSVRAEQAARLPAATSQPGEGGTSTGMGCPQCGSILVFAEGCFLCPSCGFSRC